MASGRDNNGFFSRLASYLPIVNRMVLDDEEEGDFKSNVERDEEIQTTQEDVEEEEEEVKPQEETSIMEATEKKQGQKEKVMIDASTSPMRYRTASSIIAFKKQLPVSLRHGSNKTKACTLSSTATETEGECGADSLVMTEQKRGEKRVFSGSIPQPKKLRVSTTPRRQKSTSSSPRDSPITVLKKKKSITLEEFNRLQHQLYELVETTPQAQLTMAQAALANGLDRPFTRGFPSPTSFPGYVPGSSTNPKNGVLGVQHEEKDTKNGGLGVQNEEKNPKNGVPFGKHPRKRENRPICLLDTSWRGQMTREERLMRRPRPSRLLTATERNASVRSACSAGLVEKILAMFDKVQSPLEREAQKPTPTPSTSMSWSKYHITLVDGQQTKRLVNEVESDMDEVSPPTATVPRVVFPQPSNKPAALLFDSTSNTASGTPSKSANDEPNSVASLFSPQAASMTPAPTAKKTCVPEQLTCETTGKFKFTLPLRAEGTKQVDMDGEDTRVQFVFSPPPSMREPPMKVLSRNAAFKANSRAPFNFVPSSPKMKTTEWVSKPPTVKEPEKLVNETRKLVAIETAKEAGSGLTAAAPPPSFVAAVNPLAKFMQLKPGQWKCPVCSVLNEAANAKCPCCETTKPGGEVTEKISASSNAPGAISSTGFSFGVDGKKDAEKSAAGSITEGGFSFGAPSVGSKKDEEKSTASTVPGAISPSGFSFGVDGKKDAEKPAAGSITKDGFSFGALFVDSKNDEDKSAAVAYTGSFGFGAHATNAAINADRCAAVNTPGGFNFTAPAALSEKLTAGDFTSDATDASNVTTDSSVSTAPISFGFLASVKNTDDALAKVPVMTGKAASAPYFSFGVPAALAPTSDQSLAATNGSSVLSGFTFGATSVSTADGTGKRKAPELEASTSESGALFSFGATVPTNAGATTINAASGITNFGVGKEPALARSNESDRPKKRFVGAMDSSGSKPDTSIITSNAVSKPPQVPIKGTTKALSSTPSFTFGGSSSPVTARDPKEATTSTFSFGATSTGKAVVPTEAREMMPSTTGFTFGSSSAAEPKPTASFRQNTKCKSPAFSFGAAAPALLAQTTSTSAVPPAGFTFSQNATLATSRAPDASAAPSAAAFGFGASTSTRPTTEVPSAAASTPAFTFGSSSTKISTGSSTFGQTLPSTSSFGSTSTTSEPSSSTVFGSGSIAGGFGNTFPAAPSTTFGNHAPVAPAFSFNAPSQAPAASGHGPMAGQSAFSFGASSAPTPNGYGAAPAVTSGFGSRGPSGGFGAASGNFGPSGPAPAFGNQAGGGFGSNFPPPTPTFGATGFGAPASGFGSGPPSTGFRAPNPTPPFGAVQAASAFGGAPNMSFGATTPAPTFGAPAASAFGAPADGGFNMGTAPQHAKGRRILKAKSRNRRTS